MARHGEEGVEEETNVAFEREYGASVQRPALRCPKIANSMDPGKSGYHVHPCWFQKCQRIGSQCEVRREPVKQRNERPNSTGLPFPSWKNWVIILTITKALKNDRTL